MANSKTTAGCNYLAATVLVGFLFTVAVSAQGTPVPDGLYLRFNEGSGSATSNDALPGTLAPPIVLGVSGWIGPPSSPYLGASALDTAASNQTPSIVTGAPYAFAASWTIEFAVDLASNFLPNTAFSTTVVEDPSIGLNVAVATQGFGTWEIVGSLPLASGGTFSFTSSSFAPTTIWTFISVVCDATNGSLSIHRDAALENIVYLPAGQSVSVVSANPAGMYVGGTTSPVGAGAFQPLDEVRIWNSARTPTEIAAGFTTEAVVKGLETTAAVGFNAASSTFTIVGTVVGVRVDNGSIITVPTADAVIGYSVLATGTYAGSDLTTYSDIVLSPATIVIQNSAAVDSLSISSVFSAALGTGLGFVFGGPLATFPESRVPLASAPGPVGNRQGSGSAVLDALARRLVGGSNLSLVLAGSGPFPTLVSIEADYNSPSYTPMFAARTNGSGSFELGILGCPAGAPIFNLFALNPTGQIGAGGFFGIDFTSFTMAQIQMPLTTHPFRVTANAFGNYFFAVPTGTIAPGLTVDHVAVVLYPSPGYLISSRVARLFF